MKKIYKILSLALTVGALAACSEKEPFSTASSEDYPRIIDPIFPDWTDGVKPTVSNISRDANFNMTLTVTPADYCNVEWYLDGDMVAEGNTIDMNLKAGVYDFKVVVSTEAGFSTYREGLVQVNPLDSDPWADEIGYERIIAPGKASILYGNNLEKVSRIVIGDKTVTDVAYTASEDGNYITYTVPSDLADGTYRIILVDNDGNEFGGDLLTVTSEALVTSGAGRTGAGKEWVMTGINLDKISSVTIGDKTITDFIKKTATEISLTCPDLEAGEYKLTGSTSDGSSIIFYTDGGNVTETTTVIAAANVLWEGRHYVSWERDDDDPNKTFNLISMDVFATMKPGTVISIQYSINPDDSYHKINAMTTHWSPLSGSLETEVYEDGVYTITLTQDDLDKIQNESGFICVGHGIYIVLVTAE